MDHFIKAVKTTFDGHEDVIFVKDRNSVYRFVNRKYLEINDVEAPIGKTDFDFHDRRNPERFREADLKVLNGETIQYDTKVHTREGKISHYSIIKSPIYDSNNEIIGIYGSCRNIDAQVQNRMELNKTNQILETLLDAIPYPVFIKNKDGVYYKVNNAYKNEIYTVSKDFEGKTDFDMHPPAEAKYFHEKDLRVMQSKKRDIYITEGSDTGKKYFITKDPLINENGEVIGVVGVVNLFVDIDEIREELLKNRKIDSLAQFTGGIAHDLNNILTSVLGISSVLKVDETDEDKVEKLELLENATRQAADLIEKLQTFAHTRPMSNEKMEINSVVSNVVSIIKTNYKMEIKISENYCDKKLIVLGDQSQISQVVLNLVMNAIEAFTQTENPRINITVKSEIINSNFENYLIKPTHPQTNEYVTIIVEDNGSGIDQFVLNRIFDPYFTTKEADGGSGLGLSIVHGVINQHQGYLKLESVIQKGTIFHVSLPILKDE